MILSHLWTRIAALLCAGVIVFAVAGCGGDDGDSESTTEQASTQKGIEEPEDRAAVGSFIEKFIKSTRSGDAKTFCGLFEPSASEETFGSPEECVEFFKPLLKQTEIRSQYKIENLQFDGDKAEVTFKNDSGTGVLVKVDGEWYIEIPEALTDQVKAAQQQ
ncbi:MAG: nuclear transport factor 2 family protein [Actinomycetota bacterium]|nr:nuclear transport factor 2 family protein [Actinomycetota bacterium]